MTSDDVLRTYMEHWTPEQLIAIHDFCQMTSHLIWIENKDQLEELMYDPFRLNLDECDEEGDETQFELALSPFNDELP